MASSSNRKSGSSGRSTPRRRVVIGAEETVRVRYGKDKPEVEAERKNARLRGSTTSKRASGPRPTGAGKRIASARRDERDARRRVITLRRRVAFALVGVAIVAFVVASSAFVRSSAFRIEYVKVSGASHLTQAEVRSIADLPRDATMFTLDKRSIVRHVEKSAWVDRVEVDRDFPHTLHIRVVERSAVAVVDAGGANLWLVSKDGHWLGRRTAEDTATAIVIRDVEGNDAVAGKRTRSKELLNALKVVSGLSPSFRSSVKSVSAPSVDKTAVLTKEDVEIFIGEAVDLAKKQRIASEILRKERGKVVYINVRVVDSPTWRGLDTAE